jgi:hypothetical protein
MDQTPSKMGPTNGCPLSSGSDDRIDADFRAQSVIECCRKPMRGVNHNLWKTQEPSTLTYTFSHLHRVNCRIINKKLADAADSKSGDHTSPEWVVSGQISSKPTHYKRPVRRPLSASSRTASLVFCRSWPSDFLLSRLSARGRCVLVRDVPARMQFP